MVELWPGTTEEQIEAFRDALAAVPFERRRAFTFGRDLGIVEHAMDLVMISDFDDEAAYGDWVMDEEHRKVTRELLQPMAQRIVRSQIRI
jgi:hypothetical protein